MKYGQIHIFLVDGNFKIQTLSIFLSHGHEVCKTSGKASLMAFNLPTNARKLQLAITDKYFGSSNIFYHHSSFKNKFIRLCHARKSGWSFSFQVTIEYRIYPQNNDLKSNFLYVDACAFFIKSFKGIHPPRLNHTQVSKTISSTELSFILAPN